ncbi:hypothetical protein ABT160_29870 [Streptomyces sp. NPDC001941]|uniref:hypothetical protein n=1 Tax=Streptomyces sp. NPDC001941 TaxID=3154659 RepID=UPI003322E166
MPRMTFRMKAANLAATQPDAITQKPDEEHDDDHALIRPWDLTRSAQQLDGAARARSRHTGRS